MQTNSIESRVSQLTPLFTKTDDCDCPSGRVTWFTLKCSGHIAGRITDALTGDPVEDIDVWFEGGSAGNGGHAVTDALGRYAIGPLEADEGCSLIVSGPGYSYRILEDGTLPEEGWVQNVEIVRVGSIEGTIRDSNGNPIEGAKMWLFQEDVPRWGGGETVTDENGLYHFCGVDVSSESNLNGSSYEISALHPDHSFIRTIVWIAAQYGPDQGVTLDAVMPERATISGIVTSGSQGSANVLVGLSADSNGLLGEDSTVMTDGAGGYSLSVNAPATYTLFAQGEQTSVAEVQISVQPGQVFVQRLDVLPPGTISGRVYDSNGVPRGDILIEVWGDEEDQLPLIEPVYSDSEGKFGPLTLAPTPVENGYIVRAFRCDTTPGSSDEESYILVEEQSPIGVLPNGNTIIQFGGTGSNI